MKPDKILSTFFKGINDLTSELTSKSYAELAINTILNDETLGNEVLTKVSFDKGKILVDPSVNSIKEKDVKIALKTFYAKYAPNILGTLMESHINNQMEKETMKLIKKWNIIG